MDAAATPPRQRTFARSSASPLVDDTESLFHSPGFTRPWRSSSSEPHVPWSDVENMLSMARDALIAKQRIAEEALQAEDRIKRSQQHKLAEGQFLRRRAELAETDSGALLEELEVLMRTKAQVAEEKEDLERMNTILMAERELLCEQLDVSPCDTNLCQAVEALLSDVRALQGQVQALQGQRCELETELARSKEHHRRSKSVWQTKEEAYVDALQAHGVPRPPSGPHGFVVRCRSAAGGLLLQRNDLAASQSSKAMQVARGGIAKQLFQQQHHQQQHETAFEGQQFDMQQGQLKPCSPTCVDSQHSHGSLGSAGYVPSTPPTTTAMRTLSIHAAATQAGAMQRAQSLDQGMRSLALAACIERMNTQSPCCSSPSDADCGSAGEAWLGLESEEAAEQQEWQEGQQGQLQWQQEERQPVLGA